MHRQDQSDTVKAPRGNLDLWLLGRHPQLTEDAARCPKVVFLWHGLLSIDLELLADGLRTFDDVMASRRDYERRYPAPVGDFAPYNTWADK